MEQSNFQFALPSIGSNEMSTNAQGALLVNQAAAAIVSSYMEHAARVFEALHNGGAGTSFTEPYRFQAQELVDLVNEVQGALRSF